MLHIRTHLSQIHDCKRTDRMTRGINSQLDANRQSSSIPLPKPASIPDTIREAGLPNGRGELDPLGRGRFARPETKSVADEAFRVEHGAIT